MILLALFQTTRPLNAVITGGTVFVGGTLAAGREALFGGELYWAALSAALVAAGGNAVNDAFDAEIDAVNRPKRPIPAGRLSVRQAMTLGYALTAIGTSIGFALSSSMGLIALAVSVLLWSYSKTLKKTLLLGNITVAFCGGLAFVYGAMAAGQAHSGIIPALFAFLIHLGREIIKDAEDTQGDARFGARTLPVIAGRLTAQRAAAGVLSLLVIAAPVPYLLHIYSVSYLVVIIFLVNFPLIGVIFYLTHGVGERRLRRLDAMLKLIMAAGLAGLYVA